MERTSVYARDKCWQLCDSHARLLFPLSPTSRTLTQRQRGKRRASKEAPRKSSVLFDANLRNRLLLFTQWRRTQRCRRTALPSLTLHCVFCLHLARHVIAPTRASEPSRCGGTRSSLHATRGVCAHTPSTACDAAWMHSCASGCRSFIRTQLGGERIVECDTPSARLPAELPAVSIAIHSRARIANHGILRLHVESRSAAIRQHHVCQLRTTSADGRSEQTQVDGGVSTTE